MDDISEKHRKYIVKLIINDKDEQYAIWGTDLSKEDEPDNLLLSNNKMVIFNSLNEVKIKIKIFESFYFDNENLIFWARDNDFKNEYTIINLDLLKKVNSMLLKNQEWSLTLLNSINFIEDFCVQINDNNINEYFKGDIMLLKEYIYTNFFWKRNDETIKIDTLNITKIKTDLKYLHAYIQKEMYIV